MTYPGHMQAHACRSLQVYGRQAPLPELPEALFLVAFAAVDAYGLNRRLATLERTDTKAPDALALAAGAAALLRQFHPSYAEARCPCVCSLVAALHVFLCGMQLGALR